MKGVQNCTASRIGHEANCILGPTCIALRAMRTLIVQDDI